jgi:DNA-binding transcriptional LysR family regulator
MEQTNISADDYILFATIVDHESMVRAAERLGMPKATVSRRLSNLETAVGQKLLLRTTRRLTLTEYGQHFLDHCRRVAEEVATAQDFVRSHETIPHGRLRISMTEDFAKHVMPRALATFIDAYPEIQIDLDLSPRHVDLIGERFDLAFRMGMLEDDATLVARKIGEHHFGLYASPIYLSLHRPPGQPDDLLQHVSVKLLSASSQPIKWQLTRGKTKWEGIPRGRIAVNSPGIIQQLLLQGAGIGALPDRFAQEDLRLKRLVRVLPEWCLPASPVWAIMPTRRFLPAKTRAFLSHIEKFMETDHR